MASKSDYSEIVKQAEAAVASIKDSDLKGIAFGKILDTLLGQGRYEKEQGSSPQSTRERHRSRNTASKPSKKRSGPKGYVEELVDENFFKTPKTLAAVRAELGNRGHHIPM